MCLIDLSCDETPYSCMGRLCALAIESRHDRLVHCAGWMGLHACICRLVDVYTIDVLWRVRDIDSHLGFGPDPCHTLAHSSARVHECNYTVHCLCYVGITAGGFLIASNCLVPSSVVRPLYTKSSFNFKRFQLASILFGTKISSRRIPRGRFEWNTFFGYNCLRCRILDKQEVRKPSQDHDKTCKIEDPRCGVCKLRTSNQKCVFNVGKVESKVLHCLLA